jgi:hypothetical protein
VELVPPKSAKSGDERPHETAFQEPEETALPEKQRPEPTTHAQTPRNRKSLRHVKSKRFFKPTTRMITL